MAVRPADLDALAADIAGVVRIKTSATGEILPAPDVRTWTFDVVSQADFRALVSDCYTWWKEAWSTEIQTLARLSRPHTRALNDFTTTVNNLRTSHQHTPQPGVKAFASASAWIAQACGTDPPTDAAEWAACGEAFTDQTCAAGAALAAAAADVVADPALAKQWADLTATRASVDPTATTDVVLQDLGLSYSPHRLEYIRRQVDTQWKRRATTTADNAQAALEAVVEAVLIGTSFLPLPCGYSEVLDRLGIAGNLAAVHALWLAHAVAERGTYVDTAQFLDVVERTWTQITEPAAERGQ
jgi:hypothetical protein